MEEALELSDFLPVSYKAQSESELIDGPPRPHPQSVLRPTLGSNRS